jgi:CRP-like cAMP-binding protein
MNNHPDQAWLRNALLTALAPADFSSIRDHLEPVVLTRRMTLIHPDRDIDYIYFIERGLGSIVAGFPEGERIEVAIVGREGFVGVPVALGVPRTPHECFVQAAGNAHRIRSSCLEAAMREAPGMRDLLLRFVHVQTVQMACTALAHGSFNLDVRLARWLLMCQDRLGGDEVPLVHDFIAIMLGVRRAGVTTTLHVLEGGGMIRSTRGLITITDRPKLREAARESYGVAEHEYARVMGELR